MDGTLYYSEDFIDTYIYYLTNDEMLRAEMLEEYKNVTNEFSKPDQQKFVYNDKPLGDLWQILFYIAEKFNISSEANNLAFLKTREKIINVKKEFSKSNQTKILYKDKPLCDLLQKIIYNGEKIYYSNETKKFSFLKTEKKKKNGKKNTINL